MKNKVEMEDCNFNVPLIWTGPLSVRLRGKYFGSSTLQPIQNTNRDITVRDTTDLNSVCSESTRHDFFFRRWYIAWLVSWYLCKLCQLRCALTSKLPFITNTTASFHSACLPFQSIYTLHYIHACYRQNKHFFFGNKTRNKNSG